jgi:hypothetical protein
MLNAIAQRGGGAQAGAKSSVMRILDVLSTLSALGGLGSLVNTVKKCARYAITWLRRPQRRFPLAILMGGLRSLLTLPGCAPLILGESKSLPHMRRPLDAPNPKIATDQYVSGDAPQGTRR